ncbi:hypothetical protein B0A48_07450 [Cryoendolithus antarcticus]|uniref:Uncharacterized protein n=1 Tax=Cryoendolithus antarcticus TaxID=1507870 RepID=A0A1V8T6G6_9PEZI|nr:hypothetical protein B0A48_07450 [Cryoendolithus antarcticus]
MGALPSASQREVARKASSSILREDSIHVSLSDNISVVSALNEQDLEVLERKAERPDSWSMHHDCTDQRPYSSGTPGGNARAGMSTQLSALPPMSGFESDDLAFFLKTTGPTAPHRRPSKLEERVDGKRRGLRFLRFAARRAARGAVGDPHYELKLHDEGNLLHPDGVEPKVSASGKRYLALKVQDVPDAKLREGSDCVPHLRQVLYRSLPNFPEIVDSRVSVSFSEDFANAGAYDDWLYAANSKERLWHRTPAPSRQPSVVLGAVDMDHTVRMIQSSSPIRPAASNPPTPQPESATSTSIAESYQQDLNDHPAKHLDATKALSSHPVQTKRSASSPMPSIPLPHEEFPVKLPNSGRDVHMAHPSPRRFVSHPVLLQRASSIASSMYPRSFCDCPGPPPPKSPLRLRRDPRSIEAVIHPSSVSRKATPGIAPVIASISESPAPRMVSSVVTECTGPIKRPKSGGAHTVRHPLYPSSRREREERIRQRKLRDRPITQRTIDAVVHAEPPLQRRLRQVRPHIQIPGLKLGPLTTRASSSASSTASWRKITESTLTPVSSVPSQEELAAEEKTGYTPISPTASNSSPSSATICISPFMQVAEEVPVPKAKSPASKPARLIMRGEGSKYAPRPRSASVVSKRRSKGSAAGLSRPGTPNGSKRKEVTPPLHSPPPNRALPPTPPASGSEKFPQMSKALQSGAVPLDKDPKKLLPTPPTYGILPPAPLNLHRHHVSTQLQSSNQGSRAQSRISARLERLEILEKQNALLSAALMAVLRTNGALNGPLAELGDVMGELLPKSTVDGKMAWETRVARRSAASRASHIKTASEGSALEMYMSTRRGSMSGN